MSKSKVCITGANGRLGRKLVAQLSAEGHPVLGLVRGEAGAQIVREAGGEAVIAPLSDTAALAKALSGQTWVFHLAGSIRGPGKETAEVVNHHGTVQLLQALEQADRSALEAVIYTSTCAIYGDRSGLWVEEDMPPRPETAYAHSKVAAEYALLEAHKQQELPTRLVRLAAVYGAGFPFMLVEQIQNGRAWLPGEGMNFVPTVHIEDAVRGLVRVAEAGENGRIYNLSDRNPVQLKDFYGAVHSHAGGTPVRFWSTWVPSYLQERIARRNESIKARMGRRPRFTVDSLRLFTASSRMNTSRLEKELEFTWNWPDPVAGVAHVISN